MITLKNFNFSFNDLKREVQTNCIKIDFLLKNFNLIVNEFNDKSDFNMTITNQFYKKDFNDVISKNMNDFLLLTEKLNDLNEIYFITNDIINSFFDFLNDEFLRYYFLNEMYENIIILFENLDFRSIYNLIVFDYYELNNRFDFTNKDLYKSFFDFSKNFINTEV